MSIHSATDTHYRFTLHVPTRYNNGDAVSAVFFDAVASYLCDTFGAFTRTEAIGAWSDNGVIYHDPQYLYHIDCPTDQCGHTLREYASTLRDLLLQECVYVTRQAIDTWLV